MNYQNAFSCKTVIYLLTHYPGDWENSRTIKIKMGKKVMKFANKVDSVRHEAYEVPVGCSDRGVQVTTKT